MDILEKLAEKNGLSKREIETAVVTQDEKNAANIDYIAMMLGIELPEGEE